MTKDETGHTGATKDEPKVKVNGCKHLPELEITESAAHAYEHLARAYMEEMRAGRTRNTPLKVWLAGYACYLIEETLRLRLYLRRAKTHAEGQRAMIQMLCNLVNETRANANLPPIEFDETGRVLAKADPKPDRKKAIRLVRP